MNMKSSTLGTINTVVDRINMCGCRVTIPFREPVPMKVLFDGDFSSASYIPSYPATLYIFGFPGQVAVSGLMDIEQIAGNKYVVRYGTDNQVSDLMIKINAEE